MVDYTKSLGTIPIKGHLVNRLNFRKTSSVCRSNWNMHYCYFIVILFCFTEISVNVESNYVLVDDDNGENDPLESVIQNNFAEYVSKKGSRPATLDKFTRQKNLFKQYNRWKSEMNKQRLRDGLGFKTWAQGFEF